MNESGSHTNCAERTDTYLEAVSAYQDFFSGLRPQGNLVVAGIWTLPSIQDGGVVNVIQADAADTQSSGLNFDTGANAGCAYTGNDPNSQGIFGRPQLRLSKFASAFPGSPLVSVCDTDHYSDELSALAQKVGTRIGAPCLGGLPKLNTHGQPECTVGLVDASTPQAVPAAPLPVCQPSCCAAWAAWAPTQNNHTNTNPQTDPVILAACAASDPSACYCAVASTTSVCPASEAVAGVWLAGTAIPPNMDLSFHCTGP